MRLAEGSSLKGPIADFTISGFCPPREQRLFLSLPESPQAFEVAAARTFGIVNLVFPSQTVHAVPSAPLLRLGLKLYPSNT